MKFLQIFTKTPSYKKFNYYPRFYNPEEEERRERNRRIALELAEENGAKATDLQSKDQDSTENIYAYRERMQGAFRQNKIGQKPVTSADKSSTMLRLAILLILTVGLILYLQFGKIVLYGLAAIFIPLYLFSKFRNLTKRGS